MESRVKNCNLRNRWEQFPSCSESVQIVGIVKRGQFGAFLDRTLYVGVDRNRLPEMFSPMNDAMSDSVNLSLTLYCAASEEQVEGSDQCSLVIANRRFAMQRPAGAGYKTHDRVPLPDSFDKTLGQKVFLHTDSNDINKLKLE
jgi:hypothetical protein